jgi:L-threonylcarbamoyladenylate synthase
VIRIESGVSIAEAAHTAASRLLGGQLLIHPTSTVYGLGALPRPELDEEIGRLKGRPRRSPLIHLAASEVALRRARPDLEWGRAAERLSRAFWPGALTLVLDDGSAHGLAVRVDEHPAIVALLEAADGLMTSTSLNRSGDRPARCSDEVAAVAESLPESRVEVTFLDSGDLPASPPSTIVSLRGGKTRIVREGALPVEWIEMVLQEAGRGET